MNIALLRDVEAVRIPSGEKVVLPAGDEVMLTQALGGSYTVASIDQGGLFRISEQNADALGLEKKEQAEAVAGTYSQEAVWEQLRNCYDPEIPVNIVDLGLIYSLEDREENGGKHVEVKMTLTAPGCGMGPMIANDAKDRILTVPGVASANVEVVWDPPWGPERISPEGRVQLGIE